MMYVNLTIYFKWPILIFIGHVYAQSSKIRWISLLELTLKSKNCTSWKFHTQNYAMG